MMVGPITEGKDKKQRSKKRRNLLWDKVSVIDSPGSLPAQLPGKLLSAEISLKLQTQAPARG